MAETWRPGPKDEWPLLVNEAVARFKKGGLTPAELFDLGADTLVHQARKHSLTTTHTPYSGECSVVLIPKER